MKRHKKITRTPGEWVLDIVKVVFLAFVVVVTVYPFWNIFIISINDATDAIRGGLYFLPRKLSLSSYAEILGNKVGQVRCGLHELFRLCAPYLI